MSMSRRDLYAMGEPFGDSATQRKVGGGRIYGGGGSGGGGSSSGTSTQITDVPDWAKPYAKEGLGKAAALTDTEQNPYQTYDGSRQAGFTDLQTKAFGGADNMGPSAAMGTAANMAGTAGLAGLNAGANFNPYQSQNQFNSPQSYQTGQFNPNQVQGGNYNAPSMNTAQTGFNPQLQNYQMGPAQQVSTQSFNQPGAAQNYMNPYMQNVVDIQKREAQRSADIAGTQRGAQAAQSGAFGGSRQAIMDAEANRNLSQQLGDIQATGSQAAFQNAQQQFNAEQAAGLQAQQANQQAGITTGGQNLSANLATQQLGTQTGLQSSLANLSAEQQANVQNQASQLQTQGLSAQQAMQAALANQQYGLESQKLGEQSRQFGAGQDMTAAQLQAQYGLSGEQLAEQSKQYGAGLGIQGLNAATTAAGQLSNIGQQTFGQEMDVNKLQNQYGTQQQAFNQQGMDTNYQDFLNQQRYPYQQLEFMNSMLRGTPMGTVQSMYAPPPSQLSQIAGLGTAAYGVSRMAGGGEVQGYAVGGGITGLLNDNQLQDRTQSPTVSTLAKMAAQDEMQDRAQMRSGSAGQQAPQGDQPTVADEYMMSRGVASLPTGEMDFAGGGILAFAAGDVIPGPAGPDPRRGANYPQYGRMPSPPMSDAERAEFERKKEMGGLGLAYEWLSSINERKDALDVARKEKAQVPQQTSEAADARRRFAKIDPRLSTPPSMPMGGTETAQAEQGAPPADTSGQGGAGIGAPRAMGKDGFIDMFKAPSDAFSAMRTEQGKVNKAKEDVANKSRASLEKDQKEMGEYGTEREAKLKDQEAGLAGLEKRNQSMAFIEAGLAMMSGNSANAFENIGKGALVGTKAYREGMDKLDTKRTKLDEAFMNLYDLRRGEKVANKKELRAAETAFESAKVDSAQAMANITGEETKTNLTSFSKGVDAYLTSKENDLKRASSESIAAGSNAATIAAAQLRADGKERGYRTQAERSVLATLKTDFALAAKVRADKTGQLMRDLIQAKYDELGGGQGGAGDSTMQFDAQGNPI